MHRACRPGPRLGLASRSTAPLVRMPRTSSQTSNASGATRSSIKTVRSLFACRIRDSICLDFRIIRVKRKSWTISIGGEGDRQNTDFKRLSATFVNTVNVPGRYGDGRGGHGLSLLVKPASTGGFSKSWAQRIRLDGKAANVGLGAYPVVTLARARQKALANARIVSEGRDPRDRGSRAPTFEQAVEKVIEIHAENWKERRQVRRPVARQPAGLRGTEDRREARGPHQHRRRHGGAAADLVDQAGDRKARPAAHRRGHEMGGRAGLPRGQPRRGRHLRRAAQEQRPPPTLEGTAARAGRRGAPKGTRLEGAPGEVRGARWDEVDDVAATWTVPPSRMKAKLERRRVLMQQWTDCLSP